MKISLPLLGLGAALIVAPAMTTDANAQKNVPPNRNPGVTNAAAQRARQADILYWYSLVPPQIFGAFGEGDRLDLLKTKGAVYDKNRGFIEVFAPGDPNQNDVEKIQFKLFSGNKGLMVAVSQIVWNQPNVKGALGFFAMSNEGQLIDVTQQVFPYDLNAPQEAAPAANAAPPKAATPAAKNAAPPINAYLPRAGTTISTGFPETEVAGDDYRWNGSVFAKAAARKKTRN